MTLDEIAAQTVSGRAKCGAARACSRTTHIFLVNQFLTMQFTAFRNEILFETTGLLEPTGNSFIRMSPVLTKGGFMNFSRVSIACLLAVSGAVQAQSVGLLSFYSHPTNCSTLIGGSDHVGESASARFAQSLRDTMLSLQGDDQNLSTKEALNTIRELCYHKTGRQQPVVAATAMKVTQ